MTPSSTSARETKDPFLFLGQGFGTSARNLECFLWFRRPPNARARARILESVPYAVAEFARFDRELLHFGSGDTFEARVIAAHHPVHAEEEPEAALGHVVLSAEPEPREWKSFCATFEQFALDAHQATPLLAAIKPDDGTYGRRTGRWHQRSLSSAHELARRMLARDAKPRGAWSAMSLNVLEEVLPNVDAARKLRADARRAWFEWAATWVSKKGDAGVRDAFVVRAGWLLAASRESKREEMLSELPVSARRRISEVASTPKTTLAARSRKAASKKTPRTKAPDRPSASLKSALVSLLVPSLRNLGFDGTFPRFRRIVGRRTHVAWFSLDPERDGGITTELAAVATRTGTTVRQDYDRAIGIRNRKRTLLKHLSSPAEAPLLWYEDAEAKWGESWPGDLAQFLIELLERHGERWWKRA